MKKENIICPICKKQNTWTPENSAKPFCSERCKLIDLGEWADEKYKVPLESDSAQENLPGGENKED